MKAWHFIVLTLVAVIAGGLGGKSQSSAVAPIAKEGVYDRVMRTQTLRCGYAVWPPLVIKDPNTGQLSGTFPDYLAALGAALHLNVQWTEEMGWGDFPAALQAGRIDAFCSGPWPNAGRAREVDFTQPISYQAVYAYARAEDHRFDKNLAAINNPSVTLVTMDGEMSSMIADTDFPKARRIALPQLSSGGELHLNVALGKGDVTFTDLPSAAQYERNNPGKIRRVPSAAPLRVFGNPLAVARGEDAFRRMIDTATQEMLSNGQIEKILAKYEEFPGTLLRVALPYQGAKAE